MIYQNNSALLAQRRNHIGSFKDKKLGKICPQKDLNHATDLGFGRV